MDLNDLLRKGGFDPSGVMVMRHRPTERDLRTALPWLAAERPDVYNAYQRQHGHTTEAALAKATYLASFIGHEPGQALFVGLYRVAGFRELTSRQYWAIPQNSELRSLGTRGPLDGRESLWFDLDRVEYLTQWAGKLVVDWPPPERSWWRWSARNTMPVRAIHEESAFVRAMPSWDALVLTWAQLATLPNSWRAALAQWRGIYLILDSSSGKAYVGSAYGDGNILGRWREYAKKGDGGNVKLRKLDPSPFRFSILERVSPDMPAEEVIAREALWKDRLGTREFGLNDN
jgi:hypothetical protein